MYEFDFDDGCSVCVIDINNKIILYLNHKKNKRFLEFAVGRGEEDKWIHYSESDEIEKYFQRKYGNK